MLILISYSLAVADEAESSFSGLKKKKKKPVSLFFSEFKFFFWLELLGAI